MKNLFKTVIFTIILTGFLSCEDFLEENPPGFVSESNFWGTASDARTGVDGAYKPMHSVYNRWWASIDLYTDDVVSRSQGNAFYNDLGVHNLTALNNVINIRGVYSNWWAGIGRANNVIANVPAIDMDETEKNAIIGEARALRAFYYYNLVRTYGDMPIIMDAVLVEADFQKPQSSASEVYDQVIIPDLIFASENCKDALHDGHFTKWSAKLILAEVYLTRAGYRRTSQGNFEQGDPANYALSRDVAKDIIDNSPHALNTDDLVNGENITPAYGICWDKENVFSQESMLEIAYLDILGTGSWLSRECNPASGGVNYWGTNANQPFSDTGNTDRVLDMSFPGRTTNSGSFIPTPDLYDAFEDGDERRDYSLHTKYIASDGQIYLTQPTFRKYMDLDVYLNVEGTSFQYADQNTVLYRFADALLIFAEAQNEADGAPNSEAYAAINSIRNRAGLADLTAGLSQAEFRDAVYQERRVEFNGEFKRKFDLIRTNRLVSETSNINLMWTADQGALTDYRNAYNLFTGTQPWPDNEWLWPLPESEMLLNEDNNWVQNAGY